MTKYFTQTGETVIGGLVSDDTPRHAVSRVCGKAEIPAGMTAQSRP